MCHSIAWIWGQAISWNDFLFLSAGTMRLFANLNERRRCEEKKNNRGECGDAGKKTDSQVKGLWGKSVILYTENPVCEMKAFLPVSARRSYYHSFYLWTKARELRR